jgi:hypothetical protein
VRDLTVMKVFNGELRVLEVLREHAVHVLTGSVDDRVDVYTAEEGGGHS